jgi:hypothetical protein
MLVLSPALIMGVYLGAGDPHWRQWIGGAIFGSAVTLWAWVRDTPPYYVENWQRGYEGESRTAEVLTSLPDGWRIWHDVPAANGNYDHIVLGPGGLFVLDSKYLRGELRVGPKGPVVHRSLDDDAKSELRGMAPQLKARAVALRSYLRETTRFTEYVHAVVVTWSAFPQLEVAHDRCSYLAGPELVEWLRNQPQRFAPAHMVLLARAIDDLSALQAANAA